MAELGDGTEPIAPDEVLYRRIPADKKLGLHDPELGAPPSPQAFRPRQYDTTGLSVYRAKYKTPQQVAANEQGKRFYVAELRAAALLDRKIKFVPAPKPGDPGHAEITDLTYQNRRTDRAEELQVLLAREICGRVYGPFGPE